MAYSVVKRNKIHLVADPIDPQATDWVYFSYSSWLRTNESITAHAATIVGGTIVTDSTSLGTVKDSLGTSYANTYGVQFSVTSGVSSVEITHRITTSVTGTPNLGRTNIDTTAVIPVVSL